MESLRYRVFESIRTGKAESVDDIAAKVNATRSQVEDVICALLYQDKIKRKPAQYGAILGAMVNPDGRGKSPGSAKGRKLGPKGSAKKRTETPKMIPEPLLEQCWPERR